MLKKKKSLLSLPVYGFKPFVDTVRIADDMAVVVLSEDLLEARDFDAMPLSMTSRRYVAGANRRQLIDIADKEQVRAGRQSAQQAVE